MRTPRTNGREQDERVERIDEAQDATAASRRVFLGTVLALGAGATIPGCGRTTESLAALPGPAWPEPARWSPSPEPVTSAAPAAPAAAAVGGFVPRGVWTRTAPTYARMQRMRPIRYITVHHSAGPVFRVADQRTTAGHLESIRRYHNGSLGWGDIGYHYAIDRAGRVWEGRPIGWQGAHVRDHNEGNIGVVALGNFDHQMPSRAQLDAVHHHVRTLMSAHRVSVANVRTHQEWVATACPGRAMQRIIVSSRANGRFG